ncbi:hypothetical protein HH308_06285 [Gordonia sp. TBRC 11910]|uniref:Uncharacterized protein n=1 Tax=Gordonia asplenii TaxID=2725283 RepID=A0A848KR19_9ACTN|nr:hypothetical protein [Gordonia asplenii]NMO00820.1 hypothetical protein [Gordonia asplenii]
MGVAPAKIVDPVTLTPARYGLLSAIDVRPGDTRTLSGVEWEDTPLGEAVIAPNDCLNQDPITVPDGIPWSKTEPITVRAGFTCRSTGLDEQTINARALQSLTAVEGAALEGAAWEQFLADDPDLPPLTILAEAADLVAGLGAIEDHLWAHYGGTPVIHVPRRLAGRLEELRQITRDQARLTTTMGSRYAFGHYPISGPSDGDPDTPQPLPGTWLVATGQIVAHRSDVRVKPGTFAQALDTTTNEVFSIAERTYALQIDAVRVAIKITTP